MPISNENVCADRVETDKAHTLPLYCYAYEDLLPHKAMEVESDFVWTIALMMIKC